MARLPLVIGLLVFARMAGIKGLGTPAHGGLAFGRIGQKTRVVETGASKDLNLYLLETRAGCLRALPGVHKRPTPRVEIGHAPRTSCRWFPTRGGSGPVQHGRRHH